jgi:hypothetical protein
MIGWRVKRALSGRAPARSGRSGDGAAAERRRLWHHIPTTSEPAQRRGRVPNQIPMRSVDGTTFPGPNHRLPMASGFGESRGATAAPAPMASESGDVRRPRGSAASANRCPAATDQRAPRRGGVAEFIPERQRFGSTAARPPPCGMGYEARRCGAPPTPSVQPSQIRWLARSDRAPFSPGVKSGGHTRRRSANPRASRPPGKAVLPSQPRHHGPSTCPERLPRTCPTTSPSMPAA